MNYELGIKLSGRVVRGKGYGRQLGFPTANLDRWDYSRRKIKIKFGIYAGFAAYQLKAISYQLKAAIVIGPVDNRGLPKIEAHLMGFKGNLYGKKISLQLVKYIRPFRKFENEMALKTQIQKDIILIKKLIPNAQLPISNKQAGK